MSQSAPSDPAKAARRRNRTLGLVCFVVFAGMVGAAFAAVPIYRAFCQVTGYGGAVH